MLPRLEAQESLRRVTEIAIGSGVMPEDRQREIQAAWRELAREGEPMSSRRRMTGEQARVVLGGMGIGMKWQTNNN